MHILPPEKKLNKTYSRFQIPGNYTARHVWRQCFVVKVFEKIPLPYVDAASQDIWAK
jgi:hypothetical protein